MAYLGQDFVSLAAEEEAKLPFLQMRSLKTMFLMGAVISPLVINNLGAMALTSWGVTP